MNRYQPALKPTMYFIGVTTAKSSIMKVFPAWARHLNLGDVDIKGIDFLPHDKPEHYREAVRFIKADPLSLGALVTTHKLDLLKACRDLFEELDEYAGIMEEASSISKLDGKLCAGAKDPITAGLALEAFLPAHHWEKTGSQAFIIGAGGSALALSWYLMEKRHGKNRPSRIIIANRSAPRLEEMKHIHAKLGGDIPVAYVETPRPGMCDDLCKSLPEGSLVVNATGLGKDAPGSPLTDQVVFPRNGLVWEFNYRGQLVFLDQARAQKEARNLFIEDGWVYFIHGWTRVMAEVFHIDIPTTGPEFRKLAEIAASVR